jgi:hypothetical protein
MVLEEKLVLTGYRKSYPMTSEIFSYLNFDLNFMVKLRPLGPKTSKNCKNINNFFTIDFKGKIKINRA